MELALVIRELLSHKRLLLAAVAFALAAGAFATYKPSLNSPHLVQRDLQYSTASTEVYVDTRQSLAGNIYENLGENVGLATIYANLMASPGGMQLVGKYARIPGNQIWAAGPIDPLEQRVVIEPTATKRATEIVGESFPYRVEMLTDLTQPIIWIYTQAPNTTQALALANGSVAALRSFVGTAEAQGDVPDSSRVVIRSIGTATGGVVNAGITKKLFALVFICAFIGGCIAILVFVRVRAGWRRIGAIRDLEAAFNEGAPWPTASGAQEAGARRPAAVRWFRPPDDDD